MSARSSNWHKFRIHFSTVIQGNISRTSIPWAQPITEAVILLRKSFLLFLLSIFREIKKWNDWLRSGARILISASSAESAESLTSQIVTLSSWKLLEEALPPPGNHSQKTELEAKRSLLDAKLLSLTDICDNETCCCVARGIQQVRRRHTVRQPFYVLQVWRI